MGLPNLEFRIKLTIFVTDCRGLEITDDKSIAELTIFSESSNEMIENNL
jgi:hypothetical protein